MITCLLRCVFAGILGRVQAANSAATNSVHKSAYDEYIDVDIEINRALNHTVIESAIGLAGMASLDRFRYTSNKLAGAIDHLY